MIGYNRVVEPQKQATLEYGFLPSESFGGRPFGLTILLNYHDAVSLKLDTSDNNTAGYQLGITASSVLSFLDVLPEQVLELFDCGHAVVWCATVRKFHTLIFIHWPSVHSLGHGVV